MANKEVKVVNESLPAFLTPGQARGSEHVTQADLVIPRLELIQALSPCRKKSDPSYIEGAEEGMLYNSVTRELYGSEAKVVPVSYRKEWLVWKDRQKGGGFRGAFPSSDAAQAAIRLMEDGADCEVLDTAQHFCLLVQEDGSAEEIVVSMSRTKLKASRKWNSLIRITELDSFAKWYKIVAVTANNAQNQEYHTFDVANGGFVSEELYRRAEKLWAQVEAGEAKVSTDFEAEAQAEY